MLVHETAGSRRSGIVVEVEAYVGESDLASHARFGRTARNAVMYGPPGIAYVYLVYGMYDCLNVVTEPTGRPAALLVRAVEPVEGIEAMRAARVEWPSTRRRAATAPDARAAEAARLARLPEARLASGPGLVCAAFGIDRTHTGTDLCDPASRLRLERAEAPIDPARIGVGPRVGVGYAGEEWAAVPWRFAVRGHPSVSRPAPTG